MSANGRHRRPRQAPALIVAAGVTGSAIAIPLLAATSASAADASTWDRVADCESGGMWSADLGNGYFGGLQIPQKTWEEFGGQEYATRADLASRSQQIAVAEKVLDAQGPSAWASCAPLAGLTDNGAVPLVDPGAAPSRTSAPSKTPATPATPDTSRTPAGTSDDAPDDTASGSPSATPSAGATKNPATGGGKAKEGGKSGGRTTPSPSASGTPADTARGKHRGTAAPEGSASSPGVVTPTPGVVSGEDRESGRHASRGDGLTRDTEVIESGGANTDAAGDPTLLDGTYTVREGDCLWRIADENEVPGGWRALYEANKDEVGSDPDLILPGQNLDLGVS